MWGISERLVGHRVPPVEQSNTGAEVSQSDGEVYYPAFLLEDGATTADMRCMAVMPQDFVDGVVR